MMEKTQDLARAYQPYQKKIIPYLDGSLSPDEKAEFEAFVSTHPDFEVQIQQKQNELSLLKSLIPIAQPNAETIDSLETEMRQSIFNLLKEEPKNFLDRVKLSWEEWINR